MSGYAPPPAVGRRAGERAVKWGSRFKAVVRPKNAALMVRIDGRVRLADDSGWGLPEQVFERTGRSSPLVGLALKFVRAHLSPVPQCARFGRVRL